MNYHHYDINWIFKEIKGHIININNNKQINTNNYYNDYKNREESGSKRNKEHCKENYMHNLNLHHYTIDNSPMNYKKKRDKSFTNRNTPQKTAKTRNGTDSKRVNKTIDYTITPKKRNKQFEVKKSESPVLRQKTPDIGIRNIAKIHQRTPDVSHAKRRSNLELKQNNSKTKTKMINKANAHKPTHSHTNTHSFIHTNTHYINNLPKSKKKKPIKKTPNQMKKRNVPTNHTHTHSNTYIKSTIPTPSNKKNYSKPQIGLRKHQQHQQHQNKYQDSNPLTIPNNHPNQTIEDTSIFQSFGKPIMHSNQKQSIKQKNSSNGVKDEEDRNQSVQQPEVNSKQNGAKHKYNLSYQLPEENNRIDFQNLDQFSPPYAFPLNCDSPQYYNANSKITSPNKTPFPHDEYGSTDHNSLNPSTNNNRRIINDFIKRIGGTNKHPTIDYNYNSKKK